MMKEFDWYEVTSGATLMQGDILLSCPVFRANYPTVWPWPADAMVNVTTLEFTVVVMTQSCDLAHDKVQEVLLARVIDWTEMVRAELARGNESIRSSGFRRALIDGAVPGLSLLHKYQGPPALPWSVADFHRLFTTPKAFAQQFAAAAGSRLRLRPPYREHLAQAFARYFMRVGLPHDARAFEKEGNVPV